MALQNIIITGSIGTYPTLSYGQKMYVSSTDEESFPIEEVIGSNGGSMPNLFGQTTSSNLFSPINQQWSGSILTPVGMVDYIHSSQDEFINGELSGSVLEVSHQRLVDAQCETYLKVSTVPTYYKPFIYNAVDTPLSMGDFLNPVTSPNNGEIYIFDNKIITKEKALPGVPGVTEYTFKGSINYIKVNRFDVSGANNTLSLQELTNLRIKFSDLGIVDFPILTITEYPTYYLYLVNKPITYTNPYISYYYPFFPTPAGPTPPATPYTIDNNVLLHQFVASDPLGYYLDPSLSPIQDGTSLTVSIDNNSCFNPTTGNYTFKDTPNILITFTGSTTFDTGMDGYIGLYQNGSNTPSGPFYPVIVRAESFTSGYQQITGSFVPIEGNIYSFRIINEGSSGVTSTNMKWVFSQSIVPYTSSNLTILEPYLTSNFYYSDCNALYGNALNLEYDSAFYQVNYDNGSVIPSNQAQILAGTAEIAPVKSYNYAARAQIYPRYVGTKVVQQQMNVWTEGDIAPSKTPSVQSLGTYFAYFEFAGGTNPELLNKRGFKIKFLIDASGSIYQPTLDSSVPYYSNLIDSFPGTQNVSIAPYSSVGDVSQIQGIHSVLQPGVVPKPVFYSQITSYNISASSIIFGGTTGVPNYGSSVSFPTLSYNTPDYTNILDSTALPTLTLLSPDVQWNSSTYPDRNFEIINSTAATQLVPTLNIILSLQYASVSVVYATLSILKESGGTWSVIKTQIIALHNDTVLAPQLHTIVAPPQVINATDKYRVTISTTFPPSIGIPYQSGGTFSLNQTTPPSSVTLTAPFWTTGSSSRNVLTGSTQINSSVYGLTQDTISGSGYSDSIPFTVQRLDQIRFSADENQVYQVLNVVSPLESVDGRLYLTLDRNIANGTNLKSFFLRRMYPDPTFVLMNVPAAGGGLSGFIYPQYMTKDLTNNLSSIITDLQQKNLIQ
jgi:hypothetical protein